MDPRVFVGTAALGYDYILFTSMLGVVLIALVLAFAFGGVRKWLNKRTKSCS